MNWRQHRFRAICIAQQNTEAWNDGSESQDGGQIHKITIIPSYSNLTTWLNHAVRLTFQTEPILNIRIIKTADKMGLK